MWRVPLPLGRGEPKLIDRVADFGIHDTFNPDTEECEPQVGCGGGRACEATCRCTRPTTTTVVPRVSTSTLPITVTTSTSTSSTGGQATSTIPTTTTTTTAPPGGECADASAPACSADCGSGIVCTNAHCADPDQTEEGRLPWDFAGPEIWEVTRG